MLRLLKVILAVAAWQTDLVVALADGAGISANLI
jgi:hypothetical protein